MPKLVKQIGEQRLRALIDLETVNSEKREVEVVFATSNPVRVYSWEDGRLDEVLSFDDGHVRWDRINGGAPVLDNHQRYGSIEDVQIGVVVRAWKDEQGKGRALLRFDDEGKSLRIWNKVQKGQFRNISVGYNVYTYQKTERDGQVPEYRAIDWEPYEISFVPVPADAGAGVRSEQNTATNEVTIISNHKALPMTIEQLRAEVARLRGITAPTEADTARLRELETLLAEKERAAQPPAPAPAPAPTPAPAPAPSGGETDAQRAIRLERQRSTDIRTAVRAAKLGEDFADQLIDQGVSVEKARELIINKWAEADAARGIQGRNPSVAVQADETDKFRSAAIDGLALRSAQVERKSFTAEQVSAASQFRGMSLLDIAKECLEKAGVNTRGLSKMEIAGRAITSSSSDFPVILEGTNRRILLANYTAIQDVWRQFCAVGEVGDFREYKRLRMGSFSRLDKLPENAEYKNKKIPDAEFEKIAAETFGNTINVSRQMIVNDDLNAFSRLAAMLGRAAARSIEIDVFALLGLNSGLGPVMEDGKTLFHADHGNLIASGGAAPSVTQFENMRILMATQKDPSGNDYLDIRPSIGLFPIGLGGQARVTNNSQYDPDAANKLQRPNIVNGLLGNIVDTPRFSGTPYYFFANPSEEPVIEVVFLDGVQTPYLESQEEFSVDGMKWKIRLDYGVGAIGWRGAVRNPGA